MESYKRIAKETGVGVDEVRELMARAYVTRVGIPYCRTTGDGRKVDAVKVFYAVCADHCSLSVVSGAGGTIVEAVSDALAY